MAVILISTQLQHDHSSLQGINLAKKRSLVRPRFAISPGIPSGIIDTRDTIDIIGTRSAIGVFHPAPFIVVDILDAFDIRDQITSARSSPPQHRSHCSFDTTYLFIGATVPAPRPTPFRLTPPQPVLPTTPEPLSLFFRHLEPLHHSAPRFWRVPQDFCRLVGGV